MSALKTFLLCDSPEDGIAVDGLIMEYLREVDGSKASQWSGVYTDGTRFGVLWQAPANIVFGSTEDHPELLFAEEIITDGVSNWTLMEETAEGALP